MAGTKRELANAKMTAGMSFLAVLLILCAISGASAAHPQKPPALLGENVAPVIRVALILVAFGISWWAGKGLFWSLFKAWAPLPDAVGGGIGFWCFLCALSLVLAGSGELPWAVGLILVILLFVVFAPPLWRLIGARWLVALLLCGGAAFAAAFFLY